jgi:uncharacterized membrane protein
MTDQMTASAAADNRTMPAIVYGLYLLGLANGLTVLIGLLLALANRGRASERMRTHYTWQVRSCWLWVAWMMIGALLIIVGAPLSLVLIGIPLFALGWIIIGLVEVWFGARCVMGAIYLARDEPYPRPNSWFL